MSNLVELAEQLPEVPTRKGSVLVARHPVAVWLAKRTLAALATLVAASFVIYLLANALPGNVGAVILGRHAPPSAIAQLNRRLGQDAPVLSRYAHWLIGVAHGDLGTSAVSLVQGSPAAVKGIMLPALGNSLLLAGITTVLLIPVSFGLGIYAGVHAGRAADRAISIVALALVSLPEFVLGALLILLFFNTLHWFPPVALVGPGETVLSKPNELVLPVLTLLGVSSASVIRLMRAGMVEVLGQGYIEAARLNGLSGRRVVWRHAVRNALAPSVTIMAQNMQYLLGGLVIVEAVFTYPGIGSLFVDAVGAHDVTEIEGIAVTLAAAYILLNLASDFIVVMLVPKMRTNL